MYVLIAEPFIASVDAEVEVVQEEEMCLVWLPDLHLSTVVAGWRFALAV